MGIEPINTPYSVLNFNRIEFIVHRSNLLSYPPYPPDTLSQDSNLGPTKCVEAVTILG